MKTRTAAVFVIMFSFFILYGCIGGEKKPENNIENEILNEVIHKVQHEVPGNWEEPSGLTELEEFVVKAWNKTSKDGYGIDLEAQTVVLRKDKIVKALNISDNDIEIRVKGELDKFKIEGNPLNKLIHTNKVNATVEAHANSSWCKECCNGAGCRLVEFSITDYRPTPPKAKITKVAELNFSKEAEVCKGDHIEELIKIDDSHVGVNLCRTKFINVDIKKGKIVKRKVFDEKIPAYVWEVINGYLVFREDQAQIVDVFSGEAIHIGDLKDKIHGKFWTGWYAPAGDTILLDIYYPDNGTNEVIGIDKNSKEIKWRRKLIEGKGALLCERAINGNILYIFLNETVHWYLLSPDGELLWHISQNYSHHPWKRDYFIVGDYLAITCKASPIYDKEVLKPALLVRLKDGSIVKKFDKKLVCGGDHYLLFDKPGVPDVLRVLDVNTLSSLWDMKTSYVREKKECIDSNDDFALLHVIKWEHGDDILMIDVKDGYPRWVYTFPKSFFSAPYDDHAFSIGEDGVVYLAKYDKETHILTIEKISS